MKVLVSGSRTATVSEDIHNIFRNIARFKPTLILHGGAKGADKIVEIYAQANEIEQKVIVPDYQRYKRGATHVRNAQLVSLSEVVICYYAHEYPIRSAGTKSVAEKARKAGKQVIEVWREA